MAKMEVERGQDPDIHELFCHYNFLYFNGDLGACFVDWSPRIASHGSSKATCNCKASATCNINCHREVCHVCMRMLFASITEVSCTCYYYGEGCCEIRLNEALRKVCPITDLKNTLLHEMIHAFLWIKNKNSDHSDHGSHFQEKLTEINSSLIVDHQRPQGGYIIALHHEFKKGVNTYQFFHWICDTCGHMVQKITEPSASDCNENVGHNKSCKNSECDWHKHRNVCSGSYTRMPESPTNKDEHLNSKDGEKIQEIKQETIPYHTRHNIRRLHQAEGSKEMSDSKTTSEKENYFPTSTSAKRNSVKDSFTDDDCSKELNLREEDPMDLKLQSHAMAQQTRSGFKAVDSKSENRPSDKKRTRDGESKRHRAVSNWGECVKAYKAVGEWFSVYDDEEECEDVEPLRNKRSERRKRLKLLESSQGRIPTSEEMDDAVRMQEHESTKPMRNLLQTDHM